MQQGHSSELTPSLLSFLLKSAVYSVQFKERNIDARIPVPKSSSVASAASPSGVRESVREADDGACVVLRKDDLCMWYAVGTLSCRPGRHP